MVAEQLDRGDRCLVLDLDRLQYIDSRGIYALIEMLRAVHNRSGCASIVLDNARIVRIFELSGIASAFRFFRDRTTALAAAWEWRAPARPSDAVSLSDRVCAVLSWERLQSANPG